MLFPLDKEMRLHQRLPYLGLADVPTVHGVAGLGFLAGTHMVLTGSITPLRSSDLQTPARQLTRLCKFL